MTTDREAELARRREYESRRQMVEKAARIMWEAAWPNTSWDGVSEDDRGPHLDDASDVLDAILPQINTIAELNALPVWSKLLDRNGDVWWRTHHSWDTNGDQRQQPQQWPSRYVIESVAPLTVVWQPEVTA